MIPLALRSLRYRASAFVATLLAVLIGTGLLAACGGLFESALRLDAPPQRLAGAPLVVTGKTMYDPPDGNGSVAFPERHQVPVDLVARIAGVPGVAAAVPDVSFPAIVSAAHGSAKTQDAVLAGHGWRSAALTPYTLRSGSAPAASGQVVLDADTAHAADARPGSTVGIGVDGQPRKFTVVGVAQAHHKVDTPAVFFGAVDAARFAKSPDAVDSIGVFPSRGTSAGELRARVSSRLPSGASVLTSDDRGAAEFGGIAASRIALILLSSVFGGVVAVVMGLVVSATIGLSVRQRTRELALLRASGATPQQTRQLVLVETMAIAALGVAGGLALGRTVGTWIYSLITDHGLVPHPLAFRQGILPFVAAAVLAVATTRIAAGVAAAPAGRVRPIQALSDAAVPMSVLSRPRVILAWIFAIGTVGLATTTMFMSPTNASALGGPASLTGAIAIALVAPDVLRAVVSRRTGDTLRRFAGPLGDLAAVNLRTRASQFGAVLAPITLATAIAVGNVYSQTTQDHAARHAYLEHLHADAVVMSSNGGIPAALFDRLRHAQGVAGASELVTSKGWIEKPFDHSHTSDPWPLLGVSAQTMTPEYTAHVRAGSLEDLSGETAAVPYEQAKDLGIHLGQRITVRLGDGAAVRLTVVALLDATSGYETLVLPVTLLASHTTSGLPSQILLRADPHRSASKLIAAIVSRVQAWPGIHVRGSAALAAMFDAGLDAEAWINYLLAVLAIAYAAIAIINTLAVAVLDRRRELALQRLAGATRRQTRRMLHVEGAVIAASGLALGTAVAAFTVIPMAVATSRSLLPSGPAWVFVAVVAVTFAIVGSVTAVCGRLAVQAKPLDAVSSPAE